MSPTAARFAVLAVVCAGLLAGAGKSAAAASLDPSGASAAAQVPAPAGPTQPGSALRPEAEDVNARQGDGSTLLQWAVYNGDAKEVERLIRAGADVSIANSYGATAMSLAANVGDPALLTLLLDAGADVESPNAEGQTALMVVARTGNVEAAKLLVKRGANVNAIEQWGGQTALMWASSRSQPEMVKFLVSKGADVNARGVIRNWDRKVTAEGRPKDMHRGGFTPLLYAAREGCVACIGELLKGKADINLEDPHGTTPLVLALMNMKFDAAKFLIESGADIDIWDYYGQSPLYVAVDMHAVPAGARADVASTDAATSDDLVKMLLDRGANVNMQLKLRPPIRSSLPGDRGADWRVLTIGATPLLRAAVAADVPMIKTLLEHGALIDLPLADGTTPFHATVLSAGTRARFKDEPQALAAMRVLKEAGANVHARTRESTPLHTATTRGWTNVMKELVSYGVDVDARDSDGLTSLDYAMARARIGFLQQKPPVRNDLAKLLKDMGASVENPNLPPWPNVPTPTITAQVPNDD